MAVDFNLDGRHNPDPTVLYCSIFLKAVNNDLNFVQPMCNVYLKFGSWKSKSVSENAGICTKRIFF